MTTDLYYDGAHDGITEALQEVKAALVMGYGDIKVSHYDTHLNYYLAIVDRALTDLQESYERDRRYVAKAQSQKVGIDNA